MMRSLPCRWLLPLLLGAAAATGFQPLMLWPVTLAALALLIAQIEAAPRGHDAVRIGWLFGVGHFCLGNTWIATAFTYQAQMPAWLGWIAVFLLSLYLAVYPALATFGAWTLHRRTGMSVVPALAGCWIVAEWLRGWVFTGFPWNPLGVVALGPFDRPGLARVAAWCGTYALSGLIVLLAGLWLSAWHARQRKHWRHAALAAAVPVALMIVPLPGEPADSALSYTLVQPNIGQDQMDQPRLYESQFRQLADLSTRVPADGTGPRIVLWPEGAVPDFLRPGYDQTWYQQSTYGGDPAIARDRMGAVIGPNSLLMTGATDLLITGNQNTGGQVTGAWNVITLLDPAGTIRGSYAKAHLVPYGEYLPMRTLLTPLGLSRLVAGDLDYQPGPGPRTIDLTESGWGRAAFQICYEIVFSGHVVDRRDRPDYIFNPSNDGWFGPAGPPQHLAQARLRAIEEGLPVLRSTTNGVSAVIDGGGAVRQSIRRGIAARIDGHVPAALPRTPFARFGVMLSLAWALVVLVSGLVATRRQER
jgi:apolipoprotein N-acyltransferase